MDRGTAASTDPLRRCGSVASRPLLMVSRSGLRPRSVAARSWRRSEESTGRVLSRGRRADCRGCPLGLPDGDRALEYWRSVHRDCFTRRSQSMGLGADQRMRVVCERSDVAFAEHDR
jgi:hypothetical protein